jgi:hypothetical protein
MQADESSRSRISRFDGARLRQLGAALHVPLSMTLAAASGCVAEYPADPTLDPELCGGVVCFHPRDVFVRESGDDIVITAFRPSDGGCIVPRVGTNAVGGSVVEVTLHAARAGADLPLVEGWQADAMTTPWVHARSYRVDPRDGRALSDEEAVEGDASIERLDDSGTIVVRLRGRWSSGVENEATVTTLVAHVCNGGGGVME